MKQKKDKDLKIAVLTPYKAQKYLVQDLLEKNQNFVADLKKKTVTVGTINESQGIQYKQTLIIINALLEHKK